MTAIAVGLRISDTLSLPIDATTEAFGIVGVRGSGKSYASKVLGEELTKAGQPVCVMDPLGVHWGLRSSADGEQPGLPFVILGGDHADVPLAQDAGEVVADFVIAERQPVVLDMSLMRKAEMRRFATAFLSRLYHRNRNPLHLVVDEADLFAPQRVDDPTLLGAMEDIVRRGRSKGLGCTLITQRPAVIAKDVLTQISTLIAFRLAGPQDKKALDEWVRANGTDEQRAEFLSSLASLPTGTAWVWSPHWLGLFERVEIRPLETFDSSATPKAGQTVVEPRAFAPVDLDALRERIAATIERAKADDPKELRRQIASLQAELKARPPVEPERIVERVEVAVADPEMVAALRSNLDALHDQAEAILTTIACVRASLRDGEEIVRLAQHQLSALQTRSRPEKPLTPQLAQNRKLTVPAQALKHEGVSAPQQRILDALASFEAFGIAAPSKGNVAVFADASPTSSAFANNLGRLRSLGLVDYPAGGRISLTDAGRAAAAPGRAFGSVDELHQAWYAKLSGPQGRILREAIAVYPGCISRGALADEVGASATSSAYANNLGHLRSLGLIDYRPAGFVVATELLFPEV